VLSGEHGIGLEKRDYMCLLFSEADLEPMHWLHDAFDPEDRCNPASRSPLPRLRGEQPAPPRLLAGGFLAVGDGFEAIVGAAHVERPAALRLAGARCGDRPARERARGRRLPARGA